MLNDPPRARQLTALYLVTCFAFAGCSQEAPETKETVDEGDGDGDMPGDGDDSSSGGTNTGDGGGGSETGGREMGGAGTGGDGTGGVGTGGAGTGGAGTGGDGTGGAALEGPCADYCNAVATSCSSVNAGDCFDSCDDVPAQCEDKQMQLLSCADGKKDHNCSSGPTQGAPQSCADQALALVECVEDSNIPCDLTCAANEECVVASGTPECACVDGYQFNGNVCDFDACAGGPCLAGQVCVDHLEPDLGFTCGDPPNYVFLSETATTGDVGGLAGADAICQSEADAAGLGGTYVAWLSTPTVNVGDRLAGKRGWILPNGAPFVDLLDSTPDVLAAITVYADGTVHQASERVMTETHVTGNFFSGLGDGNACGSWMDDTGGSFGHGSSDAGGPLRWTLSNGNQCSYDFYRLYCFGNDRNAPLNLNDYRKDGRLFFVSTLGWHLTDGIDAADTLCNQNAVAGGLQGTYKAMLSTSSPASTRFVPSASDVPIVNVLGLEIAPNFTSFVSSQTMKVHSANMRADGVSVLYDVVTGSDTPDQSSLPAWTCSNWTSSAPQYKQGRPEHGSGWLFWNYFSGNCSETSAKAVYCLEE